MKRFLSILILAAAVILSSCAKEPPELSRSFVSSFSAVADGAEYTGRVSLSDGRVTLTLSSPPEVAGMTYSYDGAELRSSLDGLDCVTDADSLSPASLPMLICGTLGSLGEATYSSSENDKDIYILSAASGAATITAADGVPVSVTADFSPYAVSFDVR